MRQMRAMAMTGIAATLLSGSALARQAAPVAPPPAPPRPVAAPAPAAPKAPVSRVLPRTSALLNDYVAGKRIPGIAAAIGRGSRVTYLGAGALAYDAGAAPANADSLWRVYSMTKPITAMAAMMLIEEGKLKLDEPISDFFPAFAHMTVLDDPAKDLTAHPARTLITVRELMTHTAGLGYTIVSKGPLLDAYNKAGIIPFTADPKTEAQVRAVRPKSLSDFAERVATLPLIAEPGTKWSYSIGLDVLGAVIEKASGMPFDRFLQTRLFDPLKMRSTYFTVPQSEANRLATGYFFLGNQPVPIDPAASSAYLQPPSFPYGGAGLVMSARDYDRFLHMLDNGGTLDGVRVMKPETVKLALSNLLPAGVTYGGAVSNTGGAQDPDQGFGAGGSVYLRDMPNGVSKGSYSWGGAAGTIFWLDPVKHIRATVMVNYLPADRVPLRQEATAAIYADFGH